MFICTHGRILGHRYTCTDIQIYTQKCKHIHKYIHQFHLNCFGHIRHVHCECLLWKSLKFLALTGVHPNHGVSGVISAGLLFILITALFSRSPFMHTTCLWMALGVNCALVLYDTQLICEKRRRGDTDYIWHTIELFIDFINLFRYILAILSEKKVEI